MQIHHSVRDSFLLTLTDTTRYRHGKKNSISKEIFMSCFHLVYSACENLQTPFLNPHVNPHFFITFIHIPTHTSISYAALTQMLKRHRVIFIFNLTLYIHFRFIYIYTLALHSFRSRMAVNGG